MVEAAISRASASSRRSIDRGPERPQVHRPRARGLRRSAVRDARRARPCSAARGGWRRTWPFVAASPRQPARQRARPSAVGAEDATWHTAITRIEPNEILIRGYPLDELMGRLSFAECDLPDAARRAADADDRQAVRRRARRLDRPRRDAAVDACRAQRGDHRRAAPRERGRRRAGLRDVPRRRHRELHAVPAGLPRQGRGRGRRSGRPPRRRSRRASTRGSGRRGSATGSTRATRARRVCCRWRTSWNSTASTSR